MTASVQPEAKSPSRRALLAGALGSVGALAASAIGRANPVRAATGDPVTVDGSFSGSGSTHITTTGSSGFSGTSSNTSADAVVGNATAASGNAWGVYGVSASTSGIGVRGTAYASSGTTYGVYGENGSSSGTAVRGTAFAPSGATYGVYGHSSSPAGVGVYATNLGGVAFQTAGRTKLSTSGVARISAGSTSKTITPGVNVTANSFVLLTPKANLGTRALWFTTNATADTFAIHISSSRSSATKVAWLLLG
jgi:hypothetical protein